MVNIDDFVKRLEILLDYYNLNASSFADKIGVQRSSMSHLLSGRNKPSLDFTLKILEVFPEVDLYWILNGKGTFPKNSEENNSYRNISVEPSSEKNSKTTNSPTTQMEAEKTINTADDIKISQKELTSAIVQDNRPQVSQTESEIEKIIVFYKNGTFKLYTP